MINWKDNIWKPKEYFIPKVGDSVRPVDFHRGYNPNLEEYIGKIGTVKFIDNDWPLSLEHHQRPGLIFHIRIDFGDITLSFLIVKVEDCK
jgi:hypothetical protein